jgi:hypothetical protein
MAVAGETVTVGCKLPAGIILDIRDKPTVVKDELVSGRVKAQVRLRGSREQRMMETGGTVLGMSPNVQGGFGITENVSKDFWDQWVSENGDYAPFTTGLIFALPKTEAVKAEARDKKDVKSGFEPIDASKPQQSGQFKIETRTDKE